MTKRTKHDAQDDEYTPLLTGNDQQEYDSLSFATVRGKNAQKAYSLEHVNDEYSNVAKVKEQFDIYDRVTKCMVVGLDHCCRMYEGLAYCINDIIVRLQRRKRRLESIEVKPETVWIDVQSPTALELKLLEQVLESFIT
jgi:Mg2+ and Co2+ transporter CorA